MKIKSPAFKHTGSIPSKYTCDGKDISPPLEIEEVPEETKSLVLIVDDPDAPVGIWTHWTVWNIDPKVKKIEEDSIPKGGKEGMTNFGSTGYGGPCPPGGEHRYFFKLYALDTMLELDSSVEADELEEEMESHIIEKAELVGLYKR